MSSASLDASLMRLDNIKESKQTVNKNKIAEAEALAAEALRMANEAKLAAARLAEVKKTLSMFSNKLEKAEQSVQKDVKSVEPVEEAPVEEAPVEEAPVEATPVEEAPAVDETPEDSPTAVVSKNLVNDDVVKVVEVKKPANIVIEDTKKEIVAASEAPAPIVPATYESDIVEDFLDKMGVDKMCGFDNDALGFTDRPKVEPKPQVFENPTKVVYKSLSTENFLHKVSAKELAAAGQRSSKGEYQRSQVNTDFADPFGVDHDDLVLCGKLADTCEPPEYDENEPEYQ